MGAIEGPCDACGRMCKGQQVGRKVLCDYCRAAALMQVREELGVRVEGYCERCGCRTAWLVIEDRGERQAARAKRLRRVPSLVCSPCARKMRRDRAVERLKRMRENMRGRLSLCESQEGALSAVDGEAGSIGLPCPTDSKIER